MKILTLSRNKLELAQTQLRKPLITVGRSPTCDVILRAPGIKPLHFLVEWIGSGVFDSQKGTWSIVDISENADESEGLILSQESTVIGDISFQCMDSRLESREVIGGKIVESISNNQVSTPALLEFVQVRTDSGAIEEVVHLPVTSKSKVVSLSKEFKSFKVELPKMKSEHLISILLDEMPDAELLLSGKKIDLKNALPLKANDFLQVKWNGRDFYLRFVEEITSPPIPVDFWGSPLLKRLTIGALLLILLGGLVVFFTSKEAEPIPELPRIARVEVQAPPPPPPPIPPKEEVTNSITEKKSTTSESLVKDQKVASSPSKAVAAKQVKAPTAPPKSGLNTQAPVKNVNQVGLLGALSNDVKKGKGIQADKLLNDGLIKKSITSTDQSKIVLKTPPVGVLGSGHEGSPTGNKTAPGLGAASTTLSGVSKADPKSSGLIARKGGESGYKLGLSSGAGEGMGSGGVGSVGGTDGGDFSVAGGGLDRETVRRIIMSYRNQIRTCYERALISRPNLEGRIVYRWQIAPQGNVLAAKITKSTVESTNLHSCVLDVIQRMTFPKAPNGLPTTVIYPFVFQGKK